MNPFETPQTLFATFGAFVASVELTAESNAESACE
jgi:hypothetical protein